MSNRHTNIMLPLAGFCILVAGIALGIIICAGDAGDAGTSPAFRRGSPAAGPMETWSAAQVAGYVGCSVPAAQAVYARGALSAAMRDRCQKDFDLRSGRRPLGVEYGSEAWRDYTFEHGEPDDCEQAARILAEIGEGQ